MFFEHVPLSYHGFDVTDPLPVAIKALKQEEDVISPGIDTPQGFIVTYVSRRCNIKVYKGNINIAILWL